MAYIGDEITAHLLGVTGLGDIVETDGDARAVRIVVTQICRAEFERALNGRIHGNHAADTLRALQHFVDGGQALRVANGPDKVPPDNVFFALFQRRRVCKQDTALAIKNEHRFAQPVQNCGKIVLVQIFQPLCTFVPKLPGSDTSSNSRSSEQSA